MKPKIGTKVYCIYTDGIMIDTVGFIGSDSFIVEGFSNSTYEDSWEWYYEDYEKEWFTDIEKAKEELLSRFKEEFGENLKITKVYDDWYTLEEDEEELTQEEKELVKNYDVYEMIEKELNLETYNIHVKSIDNKI